MLEARGYPAYGGLRHGAGIPLTRKLEASVLEARSPGIGAEGYPAYGNLRDGAGIPLTRKLEASVLEARSLGAGGRDV